MTKPDKLNSLERKAIKNEEAAGEARWSQAAEIVRRLEHETEREIAASWINGRTGKPYDHVTVERFAAAWKEFGAVPHQKRPAFWKATEQAQGSTTRTERNEAQPPTSAQTARKLAANIADKSSPEVQAAFADELIKQPGTESSLRSITKRSSEPSPKLPTPKAEQKLGDGVFRLWEACELLLDEVPSDDARVRLTALFEKAKRLSDGGLHLLGTGELEDEFRKLMEEVGADA